MNWMFLSISSQRFGRLRIVFSSAVRHVSGKSLSDFGPRNPKFLPDQSDFDEKTVCETLTCYSNDWHRAMEFFNWVEMESGFRHTTDTFNRMIDILGKFFEFETSWDLIHRMSKTTISVPNHVTFRIMFKRYAMAHLVQEALDTFYKLDEFKLRDETSFCNLIDALCEYKHVVDAEELCLGKRKIWDIGLNVKSTKIYNMILRGWSKMGWWSKCREFWEKMDSDGVAKDLFSYSIYMDIACKRQKPWKAVKLYKEMKSKGMHLDTVVYNTVIRAIGVSQGVDFGIRMLHEMRELGYEPNVVTYNTVIKLLCENGRMKDAYKMLNEMPKRGCSPNSITYNCFFCCMEKPREILYMFDRMISSGIRPNMGTYVMLLRKFERWGFLRPALEVWKKMKELGDSPDSHAYNALIDALVQKGMLDMAKDYEDEMIAKGLSPRRRPELADKALEEKPICR